MSLCHFVSVAVLIVLLCVIPAHAFVTEFIKRSTFQQEVWATDAVWMIFLHNPDYTGDSLRDEFAVLATELADQFRFGTVDTSMDGGMAIADDFNAINQGLPVIKVIMYEGNDYMRNLSLNGGVQDLALLRVAVGKVKDMLGRRSDVHGYYTKLFFNDPKEM